MTDMRYGLVPKDRARELTGRELLQAVVDGQMPQSPISQALRFWLVEVGDGFAAFEGEVGPDLMNPFGTVHGGWALTVIDSVAGCAGHTTLPAGSAYTTIETKGNFSRPILPTDGRLRAEARVVSKGRKIISAEAVVRSSDGKVVAHGTSTLLVLEV